MAEFKCIGCGEEKESESSCTCPTCGYSMYQMPYERCEKLKSEILRFVDSLIYSDIQLSDIIFNGKSSDENRFPDFDKIQNFVCSSKTTETFSERLLNAFEQIKKHLHTPFREKYKSDMSELLFNAEKNKRHLFEVIEEFEITPEAGELKLPEITLDYSETPDEYFLADADELLEELVQLAEKIRKFIKQNNIYGTSYQKKPKKFKLSKDKDYKSDIEKSLNSVEKVLNKKYVVDIFDDGTEQLDEMFKALWDAVFILMSAPVLKIDCRYNIGSEDNLSEEDFLAKLKEIVAEQFTVIIQKIHSADFLADQNEEQLFELYNRMIDLDYYGYMKVSKGTVSKAGQSERQMENLIGLSAIKESIQKIKAFAIANKNSHDLNLHMCFYGNPGTGKTEVARIISGILYENKILPTNNVIETDRSGLVAGYVGQTALKTMERIEESMGGVLFIDEAYSLVQSDSKGDYGYEAVSTLIKAMEDYRGKFCVILAGYRNQMQDMIATNPGFSSRIQFTLDFPNYARSELQQIAALMLHKRKYTVSEPAMERILDITDVKRKESNFANAREMRNILEQVILCQNLRCVGTEDKELALVDVNSYIKDARLNLPTSGDGYAKKILTADEELEKLVGLLAIKRMIKKIKAYAKRNKDDESFNLHMCFYGNPGTGKTEVARILSRILYESGILPEAKLTETDSHGLIGRYVGETAPKTIAKVKDSMGGVLFIDEAYSLASSINSDGNSAGYGDEAIAALLKEMEDNRGKFCVILAGYQKEMTEMLRTNPGLESRIQFTLDFPDYTREELQEIAQLFLRKKKYEIADDALSLVLDIAEYFRKKPNFANARTIRNILDQVIMNQNLRTEDMDGENLIIKDDVQDYLTDEKIDLKHDTTQRKIGFC